ncbi:cytochrome c oxidase subunit II [Rhodalgimonas zhirmunskyi]|uniref:Cytochrome c oxidase subunit 2 n=1 Tax=Rhodalgimonas zhirmunskyi TaxID=2964767 RepID=A0AAJ1UD73_9RHOB|nr:cytochrome c oxidase subunit II [Rhodoalgimonas zhirmunskyi]MDQ2093747.1 cytochrome c oxidase subunit II [Rhodoalgimonas zhirmunskyi]
MRILSHLLTALAAFAAAPALAQDKLETIGKPVEGAYGFQPAATELASDIHFLDGMINIIIFGICALVLALILIIVLRYNRRANPNPSTFTHNTPVEVLWTIGPIVILVFIGAFSLPVLFKQQEIPDGDIHIKVTGHQWYWTYEYTDDEFEFDSYMIGQPASLDEDLRPADANVTPYILDDEMRAKLVDAGFNDDEFLLATDTSVIVPINKVVVMTVTADDVIHSWTIPAFGVKQDAVPGRLAQLWFEVQKPGIYFGQCSELCGKDHAYMPITVKAVSQEEYDQWLAAMKDGDEYVQLSQLND